MADYQDVDFQATAAWPTPCRRHPRVMSRREAEAYGLALLMDTKSILEGLDDGFTQKISSVEASEEKENWQVVKIELRRALHHLEKGIKPFRLNQDLLEEQQMDETQMEQGEEFVGERAMRLGLRRLRRTKLQLQELISEFVFIVDRAATLEQENTAEDMLYELQRAMETLLEGTDLVSPY